MLLTTFLFWALLGMASVRRKPGSKFYYACYTAADGTQLQKSTKSTDKKTAQKIADELEEPFRKKCTVSHGRTPSATNAPSKASPSSSNSSAVTHSGRACPLS